MYMEEYNNAFEIYYELKNDYEYKNKKKINAILKSNLSSSEKQKKIQNIQLKCIKCNQNGGTIFTTKNNELIAFCNNHNNPCELNIRLYKGITIYLPEWLMNMQKEIKNNKFDIMGYKYDLLFNFKDEETTLTEFENKINFFNEKSELYTKYLLIYLNIISNTEKNEMLDKNNYSLSILIEKLKNYYQEYKLTYQDNKLDKRLVLIDDIINLYNNDIYPLIKNIREKKYKINTVEDSNYNDYILIQKKYDLEDLNIYYENKLPMIISFNI